VKDDLGLELKKEAIENKAAVREMQLRNKKKAHPNYLALARTLAEKGFYDIALNQLKEAEKTNGKNPELFYLKGVCLRGKKEYEKAVFQFERAICIDPDYSYAYDGLGITYDMTGDPQMAAECYRKAIQLNPGNTIFYNNLGVSLMAGGKAEEAVENLRKSIAIKPDFNRAINNLGLAYGMLGKDDKAFAIFKRLGNEAVAYNNMGYVYQLRNDREKAAEMYRRAIELNPDLKSAKRNLKEIEREERTVEPQNIE
jgi:Flp pilus assembly protein TadD